MKSTVCYRVIQWLCALFSVGEGIGCAKVRRERDIAQERCITLERKLSLYHPTMPVAISDEKIINRLAWYLSNAGGAEVR